MGVLKNYMSTILLLSGIIIGGICGVVFGPEASVVKPLGDLFLNLIFVLVVPLVFFSIASALCAMKRNNMIGKVLGTTVAVFAVMSLVAGVLAYIVFTVTNPFEGVAAAAAGNAVAAAEKMGLGATLVNALSVNDLPLLLTKSNLLPLIVFAAIFGIATASAGEKAKIVSDFLEGGLAVIMKMMDIIMMAAPIGLGCYFADMTGQLGASIAGDYVKIFVIYSLLALAVFAIVHSLYVVSVGGNLRDYWRNMITPFLTAVATSSSAACMPVNIEAVKKMGISGGIAESVIPLGTNLHKDGSVMTSVVKIMFALVFFGQFEPSLVSALSILGVSFVVSTVVGAVPVGGMTAEILICAILGLDPSFAATLLLIGTITDIPATLVNSTANATGTYIVGKIINK